MRKLGILVLSVAALAGCERTATDGYTFGQPEFERTDVSVRVVAHESPAALRAAFPGKPEDGRELMAWGTVEANGNGCEVHIVDPAQLYAPEWMGHELAHCIYGRWHR